MLHDDLIQGAAGRPGRRRTRHRIEQDTPIHPGIVAWAVVEEASAWLGKPLPKRWIRELAGRANTVYARNARFRRRICSRGNEGRDWLWAFTRHWLAALLHRHAPHLHRRLPASYAAGHGLPRRPH